MKSSTHNGMKHFHRFDMHSHALTQQITGCLEEMIEELLDHWLRDIEMEAWGVHGTCYLSLHLPYIAAVCGGRTASRRWECWWCISWHTCLGVLLHVHGVLFLHYPGVVGMLACWWRHFINMIIIN